MWKLQRVIATTEPLLIGKSDPLRRGRRTSRTDISDYSAGLCQCTDGDLHDLIAERYEQAATIVTSNPDFNEWDHAVPGSRLLALATADRL